MPHSNVRTLASALATCATFCAAALTSGCRSALATQAQAPDTARAAVPADGRPGSKLWLEMRHVDLHIDERSALHIQRLRGEVIPVAPGEPAVLDDTRSFSIRVTSGEVGLRGDDLSALLNGYVFAYPGAPLKRLHARMDGTQVVLRGVLHKGVDLRFEIAATPLLEADGRVRLHPTRTRILGVNGQKLLHALGMHLDDLLDLRKSRGASVKGDDVYLEPTEILPPPAVVGRLASIRVDGDRLVQDFVRLPEDSIYDSYVRADSAAPNFVYFRGARLRFGKLLMIDTDLQIIDADQSDPFDLYLARYARQLVAGTSRTLANEGLRVLMPDYRTVANAPMPTVAARTTRSP